MRAHCPRCELPLRTCLCRWITPTDNHLPLLVLQHPAEAGQAKGSVRLLRLSLARCACAVGEHFAPDMPTAMLPGLMPMSGSVTRVPMALLFPAAPAASRSVPMATLATVAADPRPAPAAPQCLVLLDGTWRQARRLLQANPWLQALPRLALPQPPPSRYRIRLAQRPEQRSSLEAACLALGQLEQRPAHYEPLLTAFDGWVATRAALAGHQRA